jgi:hypothetical protein
VLIGKLGSANIYGEGLIDEVALFNSALSASDITSIYNSGAPGDISSLNPVGWWRMGDSNYGSGTTITDQGSGGNDGTLVNGPTFSTDVPVAPSFSNYSVSFDGSDEHMDVGNVSALSSAANVSVVMWFKMDTVSASTGAVFLHGGISAYNRFLFYVQPDQKIAVQMGAGTGTNSTLLSSTSISTGTWYFVACYKNGSNAELWLNNTQEDTTTSAPSSTTPSAGNNFHIGSDGGLYHASNYFAHGKIDEVAIWSSDLSSSQSYLWNGGTPADISSLNPVGWWRMGDNDSGSGTTITDQGSGGNDGTLVNGPTFSTDVPS